MNIGELSFVSVPDSADVGGSLLQRPAHDHDALRRRAALGECRVQGQEVMWKRIT